MKIAIIVGTRPEIIKFSPIIRICERDKIDYFVIHTGQHYSYEMDSIFFKQLKLPQPKYNLGIKSSAPHLQGEHTGKMLIEIEKILLKEMPSIVLVLGDTNTVLAGALTTKKITTTKSFTGFDIKLGHIEACIRSHWDEMPEEVNRKIADHLSDFLYAPTAKSVDNAHRENIDMSKIIITGNTIVDAVHQISEIAKDVKILDDMKLDGQKYLVATMHRQENVNSEKRFVGILKGLEKIYKKYRMPIVYPIHPRTRKIIDKMGIVMPEGVIETEPLGVLEFFQLQKNACLVLTDSGGVQEETCILGVPCVTLRDNTERPETLDVGSNILAGADPDVILSCVDEMLTRPREWKNPFGDGNAAEKIIQHILKNV
ncbi:MAG TPA: UDP-N-acetylglucosamine 2-epimerase (non-hydrolyzing) [archaeon]|nr:UDP-N-acetylglucosamine 2-epimerase (non-hydrolyzing) [archaeon]